MANEKRLIKVSDATRVYNGIALYMAENSYLNDTALDVLKMVASWLNEAPEVDAVEVKHGRWMQTQEPLGWHDVDCVECSACHESWIIDEDLCLEDYACYWNYCPNCGAKMDGDGNA